MKIFKELRQKFLMWNEKIYKIYNNIKIYKNIQYKEREIILIHRELTLRFFDMIFNLLNFY